MGVGGVGIGQSSSIQTTYLADARTGSSDAKVTKAMSLILKRPVDRSSPPLPIGSKIDVAIGGLVKIADLNPKLSLDDGVRYQMLQRVKDSTKWLDWGGLPEWVKRDYISADGLQDRLTTASLNAQKAKTAPLPLLDPQAAVQWIGALPLVGPPLRRLTANYLANQHPDAVLKTARREVDQFLQSKFLNSTKP